MSLEKGLIEIAGEVGQKAIETYGMIFPGTAMRSRSNAVRGMVRSVMDDIAAIRKLAESGDISNEMATALINMAFELRGSTQRVNECFVKAAPMIEDDSHPEDLDPEWVDYWRMHAGKARDEDVQAIWGAVLAGEVNLPGSVSKRTMSILADMSNSEAKLFEKLCSMCIGGHSDVLGTPYQSIQPLLKCDAELTTYNRGAFSYNELLDLELAGLISINSSISYHVVDRELYNIGDTMYGLQCDSPKSLVFDSVLTPSGVQLSRFCTVGSFVDMEMLFVKKAQECGFTVNRMSKTSDGKYVSSYVFPDESSN